MPLPEKTSRYWLSTSYVRANSPNVPVVRVLEGSTIAGVQRRDDGLIEVFILTPMPDQQGGTGQ